MTTDLIHAHALNAGYPRGGSVLRELSLNLQAGLIHGLIGPNGAGKTTLLRVLAGQLPAEGELAVFGEHPFDNPAVLDRTVLAGIDAPLPAAWPVRKILAVGAARHVTWDAGRATQLVERFGLPTDRNYSELSRGQKSTASLIFACASGCELMLLDEPYLGLDTARRDAFYRTIQEEMERLPRTIIMSTHHLHESEKLLDTVLFLEDGHLALAGPVEDLAEQILQLVGPAEEVDRVISRLGNVPELHREDMSIGRRSIIDLRATPERADAAFDTARQLGGRVQVSEVTLEQAVLALGGDHR